MKRILSFILIPFFIISCDNDSYETFPKEGEYTISKVKKRGKRRRRGFYVEGHKQKIRYRKIRESHYKVGDKILLQYDSIVNRSKGTYIIKLPSRFEE